MKKNCKKPKCETFELLSELLIWWFVVRDVEKTTKKKIDGNDLLPVVAYCAFLFQFNFFLLCFNLILSILA